MWMMLAVVLPALFIMAYLQIPENKLKNIPINKGDRILEINLKQVQKHYELELELLSPLVSAGTLVYLSAQADAIEGASLLGTRRRNRTLHL